MRIVLRVLCLIIFMPLAACMGTGEGTIAEPKRPDITRMPDGSLFAVATGTNSINAAATMAAVYQPVGHGRYIQTAGEVAHGPTVGGQVLVGVTSGLGAAAVQTVGGIVMTGMKSGCGENCGGNPTYNILENTSVAQAQNSSNVDVRNQSGGGCKTCGVLGH